MESPTPLTEQDYFRIINAAQLHGFHFLASVLLCLYLKDFPGDRARTLTGTSNPVSK